MVMGVPRSHVFSGTLQHHATKAIVRRSWPAAWPLRSTASVTLRGCFVAMPVSGLEHYSRAAGRRAMGGRCSLTTAGSVTASAVGLLRGQPAGRRPARLRERASGRSLCGVIRPLPVP
jgi:hypothetical protein